MLWKSNRTLRSFCLTCQHLLLRFKVRRKDAKETEYAEICPVLIYCRVQGEPSPTHKYQISCQLVDAFNSSVISSVILIKSSLAILSTFHSRLDACMHVNVGNMRKSRVILNNSQSAVVHRLLSSRPTAQGNAWKFWIKKLSIYFTYIAALNCSFTRLCYHARNNALNFWTIRKWDWIMEAKLRRKL
jgi:hypothetical protein